MWFPQEGAARRVGEQTEQLWSIIKPFCKRARYMTTAHWHDGLNQLLMLITKRKQLSIPALLEGKLARIDKKKGACCGWHACVHVCRSELLAVLGCLAYTAPLVWCAVTCEAELAGIVAEAALHGVADLVAAAAALEQAEHGPRAALSLAGQYVEACMMLGGQDGLASCKARVMMVVPGNVGMHLNHLGDNDDARTKLVTRRDRLAVRLDMPIGMHWLEDSSEYLAGQAEVLERIIHRNRHLVEEQVFKRKLILQDLEQVESGKNSEKLRKSLAATRT